MNQPIRMCLCGNVAVERITSGDRCQRCKDLESAEAALWRHEEWHTSQQRKRLARQVIEPYRVRINYGH